MCLVVVVGADVVFIDVDVIVIVVVVVIIAAFADVVAADAVEVIIGIAFAVGIDGVIDGDVVDATIVVVVVVVDVVVVAVQPQSGNYLADEGPVLKVVLNV